MLTVTQAQKLVLAQARPLPATAMPLADALGLVLADDVRSDLDMPPYDKALMDGYAVRSADLPSGRGVLQVIEEVTAGRMPTRALGPNQAARIMTGAPIPRGADAVVMSERTTPLDATRVQIEEKEAVKPRQNVLERGREMRQGEVVLRAGAKIRPQEVGLLAGVGRTSVQANPKPAVAVLPTGDELVETSQPPGPGQIRNSNGPMLMAQVLRAGCQPRAVGIAHDRVDHLRDLVSDGLRSDVLILSGGVSAGQLDLVPGVLNALGVKAHFHKVEMKPGKPILFGVKQREESLPPRLVFGLPGNPVSSFVCFELFVRPALARLQGQLNPGPNILQAELVEDFPYRSDRPTYHPANLAAGDDGWRVGAVPWFGSADLRALTAANALILFPAGDHRHRAGEPYPVLVLE